MRIFITGASGFLGSNLVEYLRTQNRVVNSVCVSKVNLLDKNRLRQIVGHFNPDLVVHLAAKATPSDKDADAMWATNVDGTRNLLDAMPPTARIVFASTVNVYGNTNSDRPAIENDMLSPTTLYAASKIACEALIKTYVAQQKIAGYTILRLAGMVGPNMTHGLISDLIKKSLDDNPTIELWGQWPGSVKSYISTTDVSRAILDSCSFTRANEVLNLASNSLTVETVANLVQHHFGTSKPYKWTNTSYPGDLKYSYISSRKARKECLWLSDKPTSEEAILGGLS